MQMVPDQKRSVTLFQVFPCAVQMIRNAGSPIQYWPDHLLMNYERTPVLSIYAVKEKLEVQFSQGNLLMNCTTLGCGCMEEEYEICQ